MFNVKNDDMYDLSISRPISDFWQSAILKSYTLRDLEKVLRGNIWILQIWSRVDNNKVYNIFIIVYTSLDPCQVGWKFCCYDVLSG